MIKEYNQKDTIVALATFPAASALGVIKISGKKSIAILTKIFLPKKKKDMRKVRTFTLHYGYIVERSKIQNPRSQINPKSKIPNEKIRYTIYDIRHTNIIDEVLVSVMRVPHSYTCEDVVEISSHGGTLLLNKIIELILSCGARMALPGEFTYRALVNGRIDFFQAEGIRHLVSAKSEEELSLAVRQLCGKTTDNNILEIRQALKEILVLTESYISFPQDQGALDFSQVKEKLRKVNQDLKSLLENVSQAKRVAEGFRCVICGRANVGKSTIFNRLLREEKVIVSRYPGTTRDVIEETLSLGGVTLKILDTAGILDAKDLITKKAIDKTNQAFSQADLVILVLDGARKLTRDDLTLIARTKDKNVLIVINKSDLKQKVDLSRLKKIVPGKAQVKISAARDKNILALEKAVLKILPKSEVKRENVLFLNQYQQQVLSKVEGNLKEAIEFLQNGYTIDFVHSSLEQAVLEFGKISGQVLSEEVLESVFSQFCIGK